MKKPIRSDYVKKYGVIGDKLWRMDLIKYNESNAAYKKAQENKKKLLYVKSKSKYWYAVGRQSFIIFFTLSEFDT